MNSTPAASSARRTAKSFAVVIEVSFSAPSARLIDATTWAHRILGAKNSLIAADARQIEDAFQARLAHAYSG